MRIFIYLNWQLDTNLFCTFFYLIVYLDNRFYFAEFFICLNFHLLEYYISQFFNQWNFVFELIYLQEHDEAILQ